MSAALKTLPDPTPAPAPAQACFSIFEDMEPKAAPPSGAMQALKEHLSQIAPGVWVSGLPEFEVPSHVLCRLVPGEAPGTYTMEPEPYPGWIRMTDDIGKRLGVIGLSSTTMRRLLWLGWVEHIRPTPDGIYISIESLLAHFRATSNDCASAETYWTPERFKAWQKTYEPISTRESDSRP